MASIRATSCRAPREWQQSGGSRRRTVPLQPVDDPGDAARDDSAAGDGGGKCPVIPHAAPILDAEGRLTYVGSDGLRYVVAEPPEMC